MTETVTRIGEGGLSGKPLKARSTDVVRYLRERLGKEFPIIAAGGIFTGADAARVRSAGAHAVLVGEALMKAADPAALIAEFRGTADARR